MPSLVYWNERGDRIVVPLDEDDVIVGRNPQAQIVLSSRMVSRNHAKVYQARGQWVLQDLKSTAGTKVNGEPVESRMLRDGDQILVGDTAMTFVAAAEPAEEHHVTHRAAMNEGSLVRAMLRVRGIDPDTATGPPPPPPWADPGFFEEEVTDEATEDLPAMFLFGTSLLDEQSAAVGELVEQDPGVAGKLLALLRISDELRRCRTRSEVCKTAVELALTGTQADRGRIALFEPGSPEPVPQYERAKRPVALPLSDAIRVSTTFVRQVMHERVGLIALEARKNPALSRARSVVVEGIRSILCTPIWDGTEITGYLYLDTQRSGRSFRREDLDLVSAIAYQAAAEIHRLNSLGGGVRSTLPEVPLERRRVTVLRAGLVGFEPLADDLQPGVAQDVLDHVVAAWCRTVEVNGGAVLSATGDALLAVFTSGIGPVSSAEPAAAASFSMLAVLHEIARTTGPVGLDLRIGLASGVALAGTVGDAEHRHAVCLGDAPGLAERLEGTGKPGRVHCDDATRSLLDGRYATEFSKLHTLGTRHEQVHSWWLTPPKR